MPSDVRKVYDLPAKFGFAGYAPEYGAQPRWSGGAQRVAPGTGF